MTVSELRKGRRAAPVMLTWHASVPANACYLSVVTLLELTRGIALNERTSALEGARLRRSYESRPKPSCRGRLLPVDEQVAERGDQLHAIRSRPDHDALLAATAIVHALRLVTP